MEEEIEFKNSTEMNQYYRAMMSEESREEEDLVAFIGGAAFFVIGFLVGMITLFGLWMVFLI